MGLRELIKQKIIYLDGGMGTMLLAKGLKAGELPERWNITHSDEIVDIHKSYYDAGSNIVSANTFGANSLKFSDDELEEIIGAAISNVRKAQHLTSNKGEKFVALDIGPTGRLLRPYGDFDFEEAVEVFAKTVRLGVKYGADLIFIETMNDSYETKAAVLAAKENSDLPVFVSNAYGEDGKLMTGASPAAMVAMLEGLGVDALGANCSLGPKQLKGVVDELLLYSSVPVILKPNAGLPCTCNGETHYDVDAGQFALDVAQAVENGVTIVGGCCGTTPEYIRSTVEKTKDIAFKAIEKKNDTIVSSYSHIVKIGEKPILIGERINPTGKKRFKQALVENDVDYILREGFNQQEKGVHILDVNVGLPEIDEKQMLETAVCELQAIINLPLQIDTADSEAMERALRRYNGKAMINSVNGKEESMSAIFPLVKKYGGVVVALTLDEGGIPATVEGRIDIAKKILRTAAEYGIDKKDIVFDTLCMAVSADSTAAPTTLKALNYIRNELCINTVLGVSNISFGLPEREAVNSGFFAFALENGLSAAIINPYSVEMMKVYYTYMTLHNMDENCSEYIRFATQTLANIKSVTSAAPTHTGEADGRVTPLQQAIVKGLKEQAAAVCIELLKTVPPLDIVNNEIVPALDIVGKGYEEKRVYLPQLLMSAEAAKSAFEKIKAFICDSGETQEKKAKIVVASVEGDIHDIGKNIVKVLLENYGFEVIDLGRNVAPEMVAQAVERENALICGLSALMTTTVPAMEKTVHLIKARMPDCKIMVGGAVLTQETADLIGADKYAKDAMEGVRYAEEIAVKAQ
ncbi:MAG: homocysteine S-methyltransferase family protein [Clostridia bacterium]|nr:homocysteine S-methyltransferase family protein [Clostridia bacterium]